jgi:hypothetical protein
LFESFVFSKIIETDNILSVSAAKKKRLNITGHDEIGQTG